MPDRKTTQWCYTDSSHNVYSIAVPRYIAEQVNDKGEPLIGSGPVTDATVGPLPEGLRPRYVTVRNPQTGRMRQVTVCTDKAPLIWTPSWPNKTILLKEKDGSLCTYEVHSLTHEGGRANHATLRLGPNQRFSGWRYTTDQGYTYIRRIETCIADQTDNNGKPLIGGETRSGVVGFPTGLKPRTITVFCTENMKSRQIIVFSADAPLWTGTATTIQLRDGESGLLPYRVRKKTVEQWTGRVPRIKSSDLPPPPDGTLEGSEALGSTLEDAFWERWQRTTTLRLIPQYPVLGYRIDFAHLATKTAIEVDGYYYHSEPERFRKDRQRDRELAESGWQVIRFAGEEVMEDTAKCVEQALRLIRSRRPGIGATNDDNASAGLLEERGE